MKRDVTRHGTDRRPGEQPGGKRDFQLDSDAESSLDDVGDSSASNAGDSDTDSEDTKDD